MEFNSNSLTKFLKSRKIWFKLHEYEEDVKIVVRARKKVPIEKLVKSLVFMNSNNEPFITILPASRKANFKKIKKILKVKDVRLAKPEEVLEYSGYSVGAVPPVFHKNIKRIVLNSNTGKMKRVFAGGGDTNKLIEMKVEDIIRLANPIVAEISE